MQQQDDSLLVHLTEARRQSEGILNFNRRLLSLSNLRGPFGTPEIPLDHLSPERRMFYARAVMRWNRGTSEIEMARPQAVVEKLLCGLQGIRGLCWIAQPDRYTIFYRCGRLFNPIEVGHEISSSLKDAFYGEMELNFTASLGMVRSLRRDPKLTALPRHAKEGKESGHRI